MSKKLFIDKENVIRLYKKYGTLSAVAMRTGHGSLTVKKILVENGIELNKYVPPRWNYKERLSGI
jgi:DNA invertase Pin-like site-specific DNA recombinase